MGQTTGNRRGGRRLAVWMVMVAAAAAPLLAQPSTLRQAAAARGIPIGAAASADEYGETDPLTTNANYVNILSTQYDMLEPGNAMKWDVTQPAIDQYNFQPGDELVSFAQKYGMRVRGHNLCWHTQFPAWLQLSNGTGGYAATATQAQMYTLLQNHINAEVTHFAGQVFAWDVVNEAFSDSTPATLGNSIWYNQPGIGIGTGSGAATDTGYIEQAFRWAHAADPNALLFYNDYNIEGPGAKFNAVLAMATDFVNRGVPINGVGFEMHNTLGLCPSNCYGGPTGLAQNMKQLAALGIQVQITEMDVRLQLSNGSATQAQLTQQAQMYEDVMNVCLQQPNCTAFQVWGVSYNDSWIPSVFTGYGAALPFDFNYSPTQAFNSLMSALQTATPAPVLKATEVVNAAGYQGGAVSPGEIVTIFAANYGWGPPNLVDHQLDATGKFSTNLAGVQVLFDNTPAPLVYALDGQVSAIVPFEVAGKQQTMIQYQYNPGSGTAVSNTAAMPVAAAVPAIFSLAETGNGPGAIENQDYSVNSVSNPEVAGNVIQIFGTGGGAVVGGAMDGALWPAVLGSLVTQPVTATIGGLSAKVDYAGPAPYLVNGAIQVDLTIPPGLTPGPQPVVITIGTAQSQSGITVAVK
jgi:endo-1,4-beta-xylanase